LENRFLGAAPKAFENWPGVISLVLKFVSDAQFSFEKPAAQCPPLYESRPEPIWRVLNSFHQVKKLLALNG
jgi:hypothetical protein